MEPAPETQAAITAVRMRQAATEPSPAPAADQPPSDAGMLGPRRRSGPSRSHQSLAAGPLLLALCVLSLSLGALIWGTRPSPAALAVTAPRTTIAILPFSYRGTRSSPTWATGWWTCSART